MIRRISDMARTKGSRNKSSRSIDERILKIEGEIEKLTIALKSKKMELKELQAEKAEEGKRRILEAIENSGKSVEEILELLKL